MKYENKTNTNTNTNTNTIKKIIKSNGFQKKINII